MQKFSAGSRPYKFTASYYRKVKNYVHQFKKKKIENHETLMPTDQSLHHSNESFKQADTVSSESLNAIALQVCSGDDFKNNSDSYSESPISSDSEESNADDVVLEERASLANELRNWSLRNGITHTALNELLKLLSLYGIQHLLRDSRTLLRTPKMIEIQQMKNGQFWYYGLQECLRNMFPDLKTSTEVLLNFHIDGLPCTGSSNHQFWPILVNAANMKEFSPMVVAIYSGNEKPPSAELFLREFVDELNQLLKNGMIINGNQLNVKINSFICDTPARCFMKCVVGFNAYHGCTKCTVTGEYYSAGRHLSFPQVDCPRRTNEDFRNKCYPDHHQKDNSTGDFIISPLEDLPIDIIKDIPVADSLHLIDLGIMKRCLKGWTQGSYNFRSKFFAPQINIRLQWLVNSNTTLPSEIHRAAKGLDCLSFWKATEYRTFLLYLGPVILKNHLRTDEYEHFLLLFCAITICSATYYTENARLLELADKLLRDYIEIFISTYGIDSISSNIHNLCHLVDDVRRFGSLPNISSYPFESALGVLKNLLRSGNRPLAQVANRLVELTKLTPTVSNASVYPLAKHETIEPSRMATGCIQAFKTLCLVESIILKANKKGQWFMTKQNKILKFLSAYYHEHQIYIYGRSLKGQFNFFHSPFESKILDIYISSSDLLNRPMSYSITDIKCKMISLQFANNRYVFMPLLHTLDHLNIT